MKFSDQQLQAYLDETLDAEVMSAIENSLRDDAALRDRLVHIVGMREAGVHGLGEIWRRHRLTCPGRQQLGSFLLGAMDQQLSDYIRFHIDVLGCRLCRANLDDLQSQSTEQQSTTELRRRRYFQTSAGYLGRNSS